MRLDMSVCLVLFLLFTGCASLATDSNPNAASVAATAPAGAVKPEQGKEDKEKAEQRRQKTKELRQKQREVEAAEVEHRVAALDRNVRQWSVEAALQKTTHELEQAKKALQMFRDVHKPRELDQKKIELDQATYHAEHQKDELGELVSMYEADEFARQTKELVLKRGRRSLEMADRSLAMAKKEIAHLETVSLPDRERDLTQKVVDAELDRRKAEVEAEKCRLETAQAVKKEQLRLADLAEDIAELQKALAEAGS